jgi:hypothetical protein
MGERADFAMSLDNYIRESETDPNLFWRLDCGDHMNLLDAAIDRIEELEARIEKVCEIHRPWRGMGAFKVRIPICIICSCEHPCPTIRALGVEK